MKKNIKITIECLNGPMDGEKKEFVDKEIITIGRLPDRDFCLVNQLDLYLSRDHAKIILENGEYFIIDNSTNGTWINENQIPKGKKVKLPKECTLKLAYIQGFHDGTHLKIKIEGSEGKSPEEKVDEIMHHLYKELLEVEKRLDRKEWVQLCEKLRNLIEGVKSVENSKGLNNILMGLVDTINAYKFSKIQKEPDDIGIVDIGCEEFDIKIIKIKNKIFSSGIFNKIKKELDKGCK